jgi:hypothetical protein
VVEAHLDEGGGALAPLFLGLGAGVEEPLPYWQLSMKRQNHDNISLFQKIFPVNI